MVVLSEREPNKLVTVRNSSPIALGLGKGENMLASDIPALLPYTREVVIVEENHVATISDTTVNIVDSDGRPVPVKPITIDWDTAAAERGGYEHFMLKEIHEQPEVLRNAMAGRIDEENQIRFEQVFNEHVWNEIDRVNIIACGTAFHAGLMGKYLFESLLRLPTNVRSLE